MLIPLLVSNGFAALLIAAAVRWPTVARRIVGVGFVAAAVFNIVAALGAPQSYVEGFAPLAVPLYQKFITGPFAQNPALFVLPIALGQLVVGLLVLLAPVGGAQIGLLGGIVFLLAITPLGLGSAFPAPLLMAVALVVLGRRFRPDPAPR